MGDTYRVTSGRHRRTDDDGNPEVFEAGDVFEPTDRELEAFGDKFEPVASNGDEWVPVRGGTAAERGIEDGGEFRLVHGTHRRTDDDGTAVVLEEGDVVELSADEIRAFGDKFEPVETGGEAEEAEEADESEVDDTEESEETVAEAEPAEGDDDVSTETDDESADADESDAGLPDPLPDGYRELQSLAGEFDDIDGNQSKAELADALRQKRESGEA